MTAQRTPGRTIRFKQLAAAIHASFEATTQHQWPLFIAAHMLKLVQSPERDESGRLVMVCRAV